MKKYFLLFSSFMAVGIGLAFSIHAGDSQKVSIYYGEFPCDRAESEFPKSFTIEKYYQGKVIRLGRTTVEIDKTPPPGDDMDENGCLDGWPFCYSSKLVFNPPIPIRGWEFVKGSLYNTKDEFYCIGIFGTINESPGDGKWILQRVGDRVMLYRDKSIENEVYFLIPTQN